MTLSLKRYKYKHNNFDNVLGMRIYYSDGSIVTCQTVGDWEVAASQRLQGVVMFEHTKCGQDRPTRVMVWNYNEYDPLDTGFIKFGELILDEEYQRIQLIALEDDNI